MAINRHPNLRLISVCDLDPKRLIDFKVSHNVTRYENYHQMMQAHPELDAVAIVTSSGMHYEHSLDIISRYAKNVVVEKPVVMRNSQGDELASTAKRHGVQVFPVHQYRFNQCVQRIKRALVKDELGKPFMATVRMRWCRTQDYYDRDLWRGTYAMDGGCCTNQGIHHLDLLRYLMGEVRKVNAVMKTNGADIEVEDTATINLEFQSGSLGLVEITTAARPEDFESSLSVLGSKGMAMLGGWATDKLLVFSPDPEEEARHSESFESAYGFGHIKIYEGVYDTLMNGGEPAVTFDDALKTMRFLHSVYRSDELKEWVSLGSDEESDRLGRPDDKLFSHYRTELI